MRYIKGFEERYSITDTGNIYSHLSDTWLVQRKDKDGYYRISLSKGKRGDQPTYRVSRLVAEAYLDNPDSKPCVNHINGDKTDDRVENLEWVTHQENTRHAWDTGLCSPYDRSLPYNRQGIIDSNKRRGRGI